MKHITVRYQPGTDLKQSILETARTHKVKAAVIVCAVGSLKKAHLRLTVKNGKPIYKTLEGDFEIVSLHGTVSQRGEGGHFHMSVSDEEGVVAGGHLMEGCLVKTTVELVLLCFTDIRYVREVDPNTGFLELMVKP